VVDDTVRGPDFVALSASTLDAKRTAVRIITRRGVVAAEDGDLDELFGDRKVLLSSVPVGGPDSEMLLSIAKTERGRDLGCAHVYRVRPDATLREVDAPIARFGSRACLSGLSRDADGTLLATIGWPSLSAGSPPTLRVDMRIERGRLDQTEDQISLRVDADETRFLARELARLDAVLAHAATFPERQAAAVARAALALSANEGVDLQLAAYQSSLGNLAASALYAELIALTREHIEHGWDELVAEPGAEDGTGGEAPPPEDADSSENLIIEPAAKP
jgi:hypothetical protein